MEPRRRSARHVGTLPGCLLILLATMGITTVLTHPSPSERSAERRPSAPRGAAPASPTAAFDPELAARGRELHARLLRAAGVDPSYAAGSLFGAVTAEPRAAIAVPEDAWKALSEDERECLRHRAASLVEPMRADPLAHFGISPDAPAAALVRANARRMGPRSWVIHAGEVEGRFGGRDVRTDREVASGGEDELTGERR